MFFGSIKEIDPADLARWSEEKPGTFRVIDVRQPAEIAGGTVPDAEAVTLHTLPLHMNEFRPDETLVFVCRSGARSYQACMFLQQQGYKQVYNLRGGMVAWAQSGLPVVPLQERRFG